VILRFLAPLSLIALAAPAAAQDITPAESAKVDTIVTETLARTGVPAASIAIVRGGKIVFAKAYGKQSDANPTASAAAAYPIASISKQFTAAAILMLQADGKLSLDDKVAKWIPGITDGDKITIRQLLSHTAGLQDYWPQDYSFAAMLKPITPQQIVDRWAKKPLDFAPGTAWQYSNTGYVVAGMIVEKAASKPLLAYLQDRVFKPLGMKVVDQDLAIGKDYPQGYQRFALGPVRAERPAAKGWLFAAGELAMSASDLAKWDIQRMNRTLLTPQQWQEQETPIAPSKTYGLGVDAGVADGRKYVEHSGEGVGFLLENTVFPDDKVAVVVLTNADFSNAFTSISEQIIGTILPGAPDPEATKTADARAMFDALVAGKPDRSKLTDDANYYFTDTVIGDYRESLGTLGAPTSFKAVRTARLRGGFVNRNYIVTYRDRKLAVVTYAEPGENGRYEQFLVMPAE
jgi:CubicO group peptidase (beta-lactamase class C family)